jgi:hypothetical protein
MGLGGDATFVNAQLGRLVGPDALRDTSRLGAPFGQSTGWFPSDDQIHFLVIKAIGLVAESPYTVGAVYFILCFPAIALTAYWLLRGLGCARLPCVVASVLFSVMPGHQLKYEHLWLAGYWVVPLGLWLVCRVGLGRPVWRRVGAGTVRATWAALAFNARTVLLAVCVAIGDVYYLAFTLILLAVVTVLRASRGERRFLLGVVALTALMGVVAGTAILSSSSGRSTDLVTGPTPAARAPGESETFAGKFMDLVLPWFQHRAEPLRFLTAAYNVGTEPTVEHPALGIVALAGVVLLLVACIRALFHPDRRLSPLLGLLGVLTITSLAFYTKGGMGSFVALFLNPQIRTWSRLYLYIGFLGLTTVALGLTMLGRRRRSRWIPAFAVTLMIVGVLDQTNPSAAPDYAANRARLTETADFTTTLERSLPAGCPVFQLPVIQFPESPAPGDMKDYDHLLPYLTSHSLRWSYGAMRGTARADWQLALPTDDPQALARDVAAAGFCALEIDTAGYSPASDPTKALQSLLGDPLATSSHGRLVAFRLASGHAGPPAPTPADGTESGWDVLHPLIARVNAFPAEEADGQVFNWLGPHGGLVFGNMTGATIHDVTVTLNLKAMSGRPWQLTLATPDGLHRRITVPAWESQRVTATLSLPPGRSELLLTSDLREAVTLLDGRTVSGRLLGVSLSTPQQSPRAAVVPRAAPE